MNTLSQVHNPTIVSWMHKGKLKRLETDFVCEICGEVRQGKYHSYDHVFPKSKGGIDYGLNLRHTCVKCNMRKGDMIPQKNDILNLIDRLKTALLELEDYIDDTFEYEKTQLYNNICKNYDAINVDHRILIEKRIKIIKKHIAYTHKVRIMHITNFLKILKDTLKGNQND